MRLIHTPTLQLREFVTEIPDYVILSHTWGDEEVSFDDFNQPHAQNLAGFEKVRQCCAQAVQDGFEYAWIDTCCIDKRSSAELSEAINSMWKWYWRASICYAFLSDVSQSATPNREELMQSFKNSRWFTRGWTLQELLAPAVVEFYDSNWTILGTKSSLLDIISDITRIDRLALSSRSKIRLASVAQKLSWAAKRVTSREEDIAYCLLGLLNVNMPLLYGEGKRAFYRLQLELIKASNEHTLFAWETYAPGTQSLGLLADDPLKFIRSGKVRATKTDVPGHVMTNRGLVIHLPCLPYPLAQNQLLAILNCYFDDPSESKGGKVGILLETHGLGRYWRVRPHHMQAISHVDAAKAELRELCIVANDSTAQVEDFTRIPYGVSVSALPSFETRFSVQYLAKCSPRFQNDQFVGMDGPLELPPSTFFKFEPDDYASILFSDDGGCTFLLTFGQRSYSMIWLHVQPAIRKSQFDEGMKRARMETIVDADLHRDAADMELEDGSMISVRAKKMRQDGIVGWQILINATGPSMDSDTTMVDEMEGASTTIPKDTDSPIRLSIPDSGTSGTLLEQLPFATAPSTIIS